MKTLKGIVIDKINKDNSGNSFFELIERSKWKNSILNDNEVMNLAADKGISLSKITTSKFFKDKNYLKKCLFFYENLEFLFEINSPYVKEKNFIKYAFTKSGSEIDSLKVLKKYKSIFYKDRDIMRLIIKKRGDAIIHSDKLFINDEKFVLYSLNELKKQNKNDFNGRLELVILSWPNKHPLKKYYRNKHFVDLAITLDGNIYPELSLKQRLSRNYALSAVSYHYLNLKYVPYEHSNYREILIEAMKDKAWGPCQAIEYMNPKYNSDEEVLLAGIKAMSESNGGMLSGKDGYKFFWKYVDKKLKKNKNFIMTAIILGFTSILYKEYVLNKINDNEIKKLYEAKRAEELIRLS